MTAARLFVSFSGGKSSAFMAWKLKQEFGHLYQMVFGFANTGEENEETLRFANRCDREFGLNLVWLEAVVHNRARTATTHKVVTYETASRRGEPFEAVIQKYGIPNTAWPHCTRELKLNPIRAYLDSIGWTKGTYVTAVGIRADEKRRIRKDAVQANIIYPMAQMFPTTKPEINDFWEQQPFTLNLQEHQGNCKWCWKKSLRKHAMIARENPEFFDFPARMEQLYGLNGYNVNGHKRVFFRGNTSTEGLFAILNNSSAPPLTIDPDENSGCSESCEAFGDEGAQLGS